MASSMGTGVSPGSISYRPPLWLVNSLSEYRHLEKSVKKSIMPFKHPTPPQRQRSWAGVGGWGGGPGRDAGGSVVCLTTGGYKQGSRWGAAGGHAATPGTGGKKLGGSRAPHPMRGSRCSAHRPQPKPDCPHQGPWQSMVHKHTELTFNLTTEKLKDKKQKTNNKNYKRFKKKKKRKEVTGSRNSLALSLIYQPASRASSHPPAWRSTSCRVRSPGVAAPADSSSARAQDRAPGQLCML